MSDQVGNQNFGFLMTWLKLFALLQYTCGILHHKESVHGLCSLLTASGNIVGRMKDVQIAVFQASHVFQTRFHEADSTEFTNTETFDHKTKICFIFCVISASFLETCFITTCTVPQQKSSLISTFAVYFLYIVSIYYI